MPVTLERVEIWSNLQAASGTRQAFCPVLSCNTVESLDGKTATQRLTMTVPRDATTAVGYLVPRSVVRLLFTDGGFEEYRIQDVVDSAQAAAVTVKANGVLFDLALGNTLLTATTTPDVVAEYVKVDTATNLMTHILTFAPSYWAVGTVTPTVTASLAVSADTALSALVKLANAVATATGTTYELSARRNGTTGYYLDLTVLNSSATAPAVRTGKNLQTLRRTRSSRDQATRVYPITSAPLGDAWWEVTAVSAGAYIDIDDISGGTVNPIVEDDALNNLYWWHEDGVAHQITDTTQSSKRLAMASTTGIAVGDWGRFALNSSGDRLIYVDQPTAQAAYGVQAVKLATDLSGVTNWLPNGDFRNWSGSYPDGYSAFGAWGAPTATTTAGLWETGGRSALCGSGATTGFSLARSSDIYIPAGWTVTYGIRYRQTATDTAESITTEVQHPDGGGAWSTLTTRADPPEANDWLTVTRTCVVATSGGKSIGLRHAGYTTHQTYVDRVWCFIQPPTDSIPADYTYDSPGATAWLRGVSYLTTNSTPPVTYEATLLDLSRLDAGTWPYDTLVLGGTVAVTDDDLGLTASVRAVQIDRDILHPLQSRVTFSTRPLVLTSVLLATE